MSQASYFKIMGGLFSVTAILAIPNVGLLLVALTLGFALPVIIAVPSGGIYGLALLPGVVIGRIWAWGLSAVLMLGIAVLPSVIAQGIGDAKRAERAADQVAAVPFKGNVNVVDLSLNGQVDCEAFCKALLAGGQVQAVRFIKPDGTESAVFTPGPEGPWFGRTDIAKADIRVERRRSNRHKVAKTWTVFERFFVDALGAEEWVVLDSATDEVVFRQGHVRYATARMPSVFMAATNGLAHGGNKGGILVHKTAVRSSVTEFAVLSEAFSGLGIALGDTKGHVDPGAELARLRTSVESALSAQDKFDRQVLGLIWDWGKALNANGPAGAEDVALYGKLLAREDTKNAYIMATTLAWNGPIRRAYLASVLAGFEAADKKKRAGFYAQVFRALALMRLSEPEAAMHRAQLATITSHILEGKPDLTVLHLVFAGAAVGLDAAVGLAQINPEGIGKLDTRDALQIIHMGLCVASVEERQGLGPVVVAWLMSEAEKGRLRWGSGSGFDLMRVLWVTGFTREVEGLIALMDPPPTAERLKRLTQEGSSQTGLCDRFHQRVASID